MSDWYSKTLADTTFAQKAVAQTVGGIWTFSAAPIIPDSSFSVSVLSDFASSVDARKGAVLGRFKKAADTSRASTTVPAADPDLTFGIGVGEEWDTDWFLKYDADQAGDLKLTVAVPTGATIQGRAVGLSGGATGVSSSQTIATWDGTASSNVYTFGGLAGTGNPTSIKMELNIVAGTTAGNVTLNWAQGTSSTTATVLKVGSVLTAVKIA